MQALHCYCVSYVSNTITLPPTGITSAREVGVEDGDKGTAAVGATGADVDKVGFMMCVLDKPKRKHCVYKIDQLAQCPIYTLLCP